MRTMMMFRSTLPAACTAPRPGVLWGPCPERREQHDAAAPRRTGGLLPGRVGTRLAAVRNEAERLQALDEAGFDHACHEVRAQLARRGWQRASLAGALALAAAAAARVLGTRAFDTQLLAALHMLDERLVEMPTGEGKSLAVALAAAAAAMAGVPVHVLTANDYLVQRDAQAFAPLYRRLRLEVASVVAGMPADERRLAYAQPVVVVTARELVFDYLRDRMHHTTSRTGLGRRAAAIAQPAAQPPLLRGLCLALVDEADSVLIDEAQMPLILSREQDDPSARAYLWQAWMLSGRLVDGADFELDRTQRQARLTPEGQDRVALLSLPLAAAWRSPRHRDQAITTALAARHLYLRDRDYIVQPGPCGQGGSRARIAIVDAVTGRRAEGRRWAGGLHAMVALKEGCRPEPELETIAQITYQRFFRRYHRLGGLSGTLQEARGELRAIYGLPMVSVATRLPCRRVQGPWRLFDTAQARWAAVRDRCAELSAAGRPVLVGTDSVADSQALSDLLRAAGLAHAVLDARHDAEEAAIVAQAGAAGRITVATSMAGRGTDIVPDEAALQAGGLHVLCCQLNPSRRIDRQLAGRAARQGQPGSTQTWISLESARFTADGAGRFSAAMLRLAHRLGAGSAGQCWLRGWHRGLQAWDEWCQARTRAHVYRNDCRIERGLSFTANP